MADSLGDLLRNYDLDEPPEIKRIKAFIRNMYKKEVAVALHDNQIIIMVPSAALAGTLRPNLHKIQKQCETDKRLILRINR
jgi:hypothetical protein